MYSIDDDNDVLAMRNDTQRSNCNFFLRQLIPNSVIREVVSILVTIAERFPAMMASADGHDGAPCARADTDFQSSSGRSNELQSSGSAHLGLVDRLLLLRL